MDEKNQLLEVLGLFIPIVGLVLYLVYQKDKPIMAKGIAVWSLIGLVINIIFLLGL